MGILGRYYGLIKHTETYLGPCETSAMELISRKLMIDS